MRLSFHGHRGKRHGSRARALCIRANEDVQHGGHRGHTPEKSLTWAGLLQFDIDHPPLVKKTYRRSL